MIQNYFSVFYFSINLGSLVSMVITPILRSDVQCFGNDCYFLAFVLFLCGTYHYKRVDPQDNIILLVIKVSYTALFIKIRRIFTKSGLRENYWLDYAKNDYSGQLIEDVKALYRLLFIFIPIPVFWTLFDQQGSRWTIQAMEMKGNLGFIGVIKPDQIQAINPILVMLLIPIFETFIYPLCAKFNLLIKPLTRMAAGMIMVVLAFLVAGSLQIRMQKLSSFANFPSAGCYHLRIFNLMPDTPINIISYQNSFPNITDLTSYNVTQYYSYNIKSQGNITARLLMDDSYLLSNRYPQDITVFSNDTDVLEALSYSFIIGLGAELNNESNIKDDYVPEYEIAKLRIIAVDNLHHNHVQTIFEIAEKKINLTAMEPSQYIKIPYGSHAVLVNGVYQRVFSFKSGSIYTIVVAFETNDKPIIHIFGDVEPRPLSILWQIPQYIILTSGEVLFSITGLDFAYSSVPYCMVIDSLNRKFYRNSLLFFTTIIFSIMSYYFIPYNPNITLMNEIQVADSIPEDFAVNCHECAQPPIN
ncbi:hypothetical protein MXB_533 [Myxobolus squamalis]|nr:hypothetical protein MXB_533 [Myxobolus squamalis]